MALADVPGLGAYIQQRQINEQRPLAELQQASGALGLLSKLQEQQQAQQLRTSLADSGGDIEKALSAAIQSGNIKAAHELAPLVKLEQERKSREQTPRLLAELNAGAAPDTGNPADWRQKRLAHLTGMTMIPAYANNPVVMQRLQAEMDKLGNVKPMVEHNFSVGGDQVQPHISFDEGRSWQPVPGSKPSAKFAKQVAPVNGPDPVVQPTADTLEMDAWRYLTDGTLPNNMGRGVQGAGQATAIRNRSAALAKDMGMTPDEIRFAQLTNKTGIQALGQLAKARAQILQFEKTANANADLATQASERVDRTGIPILNKYIQAGRTATGDPETAKFHAATETFVSEYARVMSGGYGAAQTTESAQTRAHTLLNTANTKEQFRQVVGQLKTEMGNRVKALNDQVNEERGRLKAGTRTAPPEGPRPVATTPPAQAITATGPNGEKLILKDGQWQPVK